MIASRTADGGQRLSFEDIRGGGDNDFNDAVFEVSEQAKAAPTPGFVVGPTLAPAPAPAPVLLIPPTAAPAPVAVFGPSPAPAPAFVVGPTAAPAPVAVFGPSPAPAPAAVFGPTAPQTPAQDGTFISISAETALAVMGYGPAPARGVFGPT